MLPILLTLLEAHPPGRFFPTCTITKGAVSFMTFKSLLKPKWVLCAALVVGIPLLLHLLGNPFLQFAPDKVDTTRVNCLSDFDSLVLDDAEIEDILTICSSLKAAWLPTPQFHGPPSLPKEQQP